MWKEILNVVPKVSSSDLGAMENTLHRRFSNVAKRFGQGLKVATTVALGGGIALALIDKILNPLKETQDAIDKILGKADDLDTMAKEFNTTSGKLFKLQLMGESKGIDAQQMNVLMEKFQVKVAESIADPTKASPVRQFAVKGQDTADAFLQFIQRLGEMSPEAQTRIQADVFGEKQILKVSEFLKSKPEEWREMAASFKSASVLQEAIDKKQKAVADAKMMSAKRSQDEFLIQSAAFGDSAVAAKDASERQKIGFTAERMTKVDPLTQLDMTVQKAIHEIEVLLTGGASAVLAIREIRDLMKFFTKAKGVKGVLNQFGKGGK